MDGFEFLDGEFEYLVFTFADNKQKFVFGIDIDGEQLALLFVINLYIVFENGAFGPDYQTLHALNSKLYKPPL